MDGPRSRVPLLRAAVSRPDATASRSSPEFGGALRGGVGAAAGVGAADRPRPVAVLGLDLTPSLMERRGPAGHVGLDVEVRGFLPARREGDGRDAGNGRSVQRPVADAGHGLGLIGSDVVQDHRSTTADQGDAGNGAGGAGGRVADNRRHVSPDDPATSPSPGTADAGGVDHGRRAAQPHHRRRSEKNQDDTEKNGIAPDLEGSEKKEVRRADPVGPAPDTPTDESVRSVGDPELHHSIGHVVTLPARPARSSAQRLT